MKQNKIDAKAKKILKELAPYKVERKFPTEARSGEGEDFDLKGLMLTPLYVYVLYLLYSHPAGWLMINMVASMKAMAEYAEIHEKILKYVLTRDDDGDA